MSLDVTNLSVAYGNHAALADVNLRVESGERFGIMGPSGAGKSTLLRVLAGLEPPDSGTVIVNGTDITTMPTHERPVGLMFQDNALFPHMSVHDNIAYGLRMRGLPRDRRTDRVHELLDLVSLGGFGDRSPLSLSGGEQQRVALARTLAPQPSLILFDEPLGAIDQSLKDGLLVELISIVKKVGTTSVYVTHDRTEAEAFAQRVAIMNAGSVARTDTPLALWQDPQTAFIARFIGHRNVVDGTALGLRPGPVVVPTTAIRPSKGAGITGTIVARTFRDGAYDITVDIHGQRIVMADIVGAQEGINVTVDIDEADVMALAVDEV